MNRQSPTSQRKPLCQLLTTMPVPINGYDIYLGRIASRLAQALNCLVFRGIGNVMHVLCSLYSDETRSRIGEQVLMSN